MTQIKLPFDGFYHSHPEFIIERELESQFDDGEIPDGEHDKYNWSLVRKEFAAKYTTALEHHINDNEAVNISLSFVELVSPREYNYSTDCIYAEISDLQALKSYVDDTYSERLTKLVKEAGTPVPGYAPFVSPDLEDWGDVTTWNEAQAGILLECLECIAYEESEPLVYTVMDQEMCNGGIQECLDKGLTK